MIVIVDAMLNLGSIKILKLIFSHLSNLFSYSEKNILFFQSPVGGHLGVGGLNVLGPVVEELNLEVGELSDMLDMVAENVMEAVGQKFHVIEEDIVQV